MLILPLLLCCQKAHAQTVVFTVDYDTNTVVQPGVVDFGDTVYYSFNVRNVGTVPFAGNLQIMRRKDSTNTYMIDSIAGVNLPVNGSIPVFVEDIVTLARYDGGINILVIWPTATVPGVVISTIDSVFGEVFVNPTTGTDEGKAFRGSTLYPNPAQQGFSLTMMDPNLHPTQFLLINAQGETARSWDNLPNRFDVSDQPTGMYYLVVRYSNGATERKPFILLR